MTDSTYTLVDGVAKNREHPETFWIPSEKVKDAVRPGALVKLAFEPIGDAAVGGERMWVLVMDRFDDDSFLGKLDNQPIFIDDLEFGDIVEFSLENIIDVTIPNGILELVEVLSNTEA